MKKKLKKLTGHTAKIRRDVARHATFAKSENLQ